MVLQRGALGKVSVLQHEGVQSVQHVALLGQYVLWDREAFGLVRRQEVEYCI
jgi:hypothetical protein